MAVAQRLGDHFPHDVDSLGLETLKVRQRRGTPPARAAP